MMNQDGNDNEILHHRVDQLEEHFLYHARNGFENLRKVPEEDFKRFLEVYFAGAEKGEGIDSETVAGILNLDERYVSDAMLATSLVMGAITDLSVSVDEFLETGRGKVFDVADEAIVSKLANAVVDKRTSLREAIERSSLANAILPTYQSSALEIDLRLRFDDQEKVVGGAPVAILGLRTDIEDDFYCQMSLADVRRLLKRLEEAEARLRAGARMLSEFLQ